MIMNVNQTIDLNSQTGLARGANRFQCTRKNSGCAEALQCRQTKSQAPGISQITKKGL